MGKSTNNVIKAIQYNETVTELELKCAAIALHVNRIANMSAMSTLLAEYEKDGEITKKSLDKLKRAWERQANLDKDLETFILGSSYDPRLTKDERDNKFAEYTANTAIRLLDVLGRSK